MLAPVETPRMHYMVQPIQSIIDAGSKVWLDSVDPDLVEINRNWGVTGATSNPIIIADLIKTGRFDQQLASLLNDQGLNDHDAAWAITDQIVSAAEKQFRPVWDATGGDDGYVSFELDPLLDDAEGPAASMSLSDRVDQYIALGRRWSESRSNRMIKVPATPAGLGALEELAASGVALNVTLIFSMRQYVAARDAIVRGAGRLKSLAKFKSVYSIFISRVDVYTQTHVPQLSAAAQGQVGILNVKQIWRANESYWAGRPTPLKQEIVFASTGTKNPSDPPWKNVEALVGSGIQTNPPATNEQVQQSGRTFRRTVDELPPAAVVEEIEAKTDPAHLEQTLMDEGLKKFAQPQKNLLALIADQRKSLTAK